MPFVLREENSTENPPLATVYGNQITAGKIVYYYKEGGRTKCIIFLGDGPMAGIEKLYYNGEIVPEFADAAQTTRNWKFHPGTKTTLPVFKDVSAITADTLTVTGHGYSVDDPIAFTAGVDPIPSPFPTGVKQHQKLFVHTVVNANQIKIKDSAGTLVSTWSTTGTNYDYLLANLRIYKANAGYFDPVQGRPEFFSTSTATIDPLEFTFSEIAYVEVWLSTAQTLIEPDEAPTRFKIYVRGRKLQNYTSTGLLADQNGIAFPDQDNLPEETKFFSANNALVAVDIMLNYMKISHSRINWATFVKYRDYCNAAIDWNSGVAGTSAHPNWAGAVPTSYTTTNVTESPSGTFGKTVASAVWDAGGLSTQSVPYNATDLEVSGFFVAGLVAFGISKNTAVDVNPDTALYTIRTTPGYNSVGLANSTTNFVFHVYKKGVVLPVYTSGELVEDTDPFGNSFFTFIGDYTRGGDQFKIILEGGVIKFFRNNVMFYSETASMELGDTDPIRIMFSLKNAVAKVKDLKTAYTDGLINALESPVGTLQKATQTTGWDSAGQTAQNRPYNGAGKVEVSGIYTAGNCALGLTQSATTSVDYTTALYTTEIFGLNAIKVRRLGTVLYTSNNNAVTNGSVVRMTIDSDILTVYVNNTIMYTTPVTYSGTNSIKGCFFLNVATARIEDFYFYPVSGDSRYVSRFDAHVVFPSEISSSIALEQVLGRSPGCHWQDTDGKISFVVGSSYKNLLNGDTAVDGDRVLAKIISFDPSQTTVKSNIIEDSFASYKKPPEQKQNFMRTEFRDLGDEYYTKKYTYGDRSALRDYVETLIDFGIVQIGVATQSLADRITESILRWNTDLDLFITCHATADTFEIAKGDIVKFAHDVPGWTINTAPLFIVIEETFEGDTADERSFILQAYNPDYYSDTQHGPINQLLPASPAPVLVAPQSINVTYNGLGTTSYWDKSLSDNIDKYRLTDEFNRIIAETKNLYFLETNLAKGQTYTRRVRTINTKGEVSTDFASVTFAGKGQRLELANGTNMAANTNAERTVSSTTTSAGIKHITLGTAVIASEINATLVVSPDVNTKSQGACFHPDVSAFSATYYGIYFNANGTVGTSPGDSSLGTYEGGDRFAIEMNLDANRFNRYKLNTDGTRTLLGYSGVPSAPFYYIRLFTTATTITEVNLRPELTGNLTDGLSKATGSAQNLVLATYDGTNAVSTGGSSWGSSGLSIPGIPANKDGGFFLNFPAGTVLGSGVGTAVGLSSTDTNTNITSMPFWFTVNSSGEMEFYTGNTLLASEPGPNVGSALLGNEILFIGRHGTSVYVMCGGYQVYSYTHASLDTEALMLDIAFNQSLGANWNVNGIQLVTPYSTASTPEGDALSISVTLRDEAVVGENSVYSIPKFNINTPLNKQILQYNTSLELVNVNPSALVNDVLPSQAGNSGKYLTTNGTTVSWATVAGGVSDGDKGDITVSGTGALWTIDSGVVTLAKMANMATGSLIYRKTAGSGAPEVQTLATLKTDLALTNANSGDVSLAGENYLSIAGQTITANAVNLSSTNVTGTLAAGRFPALTGDVTTTAGSLATTLATVNSNVGTFNNVTVNGKGLVTAASNVSYLTANQTITLSGEVTGSGTTSITSSITAQNSTFWRGKVTDEVGTGSWVFNNAPYFQGNVVFYSTIDVFGTGASYNTSADGVILENAGSTSAGNALWSPRLRFSGSAMNGGSVDDADTIIELRPIDYIGRAKGVLHFRFQSGHTGYTTKMTVDDDGVVTASTFSGDLTGNANTTNQLFTTRTIWGQNFNGTANVTGNLALGASSLTLTGSIGATGARATKVWATDVESTNMYTVGGVSLASTFSPVAGSGSITTVGTIASGTWQGGVIQPLYGGTGLTSLGTGVATFLGTPSGANLASALTSALPISKGGTNATSFGTTNGLVYYDGISLVNNANITYTSSQLRGPAGSVVAGNAPGISFVGFGNDGLASNGSNLAFWQNGTIALNIADGSKEYRLAADYKMSWSSATNNNSAADVTLFRNAASILETTGHFRVGSGLSNGSILVMASNSTSPQFVLGNNTATKHWAMYETLGASGQQGSFKILDYVGTLDKLEITTGGNVILGGSTATRATTQPTNAIIIPNGTAPVGARTNAIDLYASAGELRVMDAAGNSTLLSPHDVETNDWIYYSKNTKTGKVLRIKMEAMMKAICEKEGWDFIEEYFEEPYSSHLPRWAKPEKVK